MPSVITGSVMQDAILYYDREDYLKSQNTVDSYLEVGVLAGDYSDQVIRYLKPKRIDLVDRYNQKDWNQLDNMRFTSETNYDYVKNKYKDNSNVNVIQEHFRLGIKSIDHKYDYIYIDADHSQDFMEHILNFSKNHIVVGGIIGVNDYMIRDHFNDEYYGIVQATNKFLLQNHNFKICAYALGAAFHPDLYIKRIG